ncbi:hypothetical protein MsAg5_05220 [Methanosarcinaceae archaeon Ag5]|uniref:Transmembrane protein n=1 Tax=Methanolapillus africanus TaxID=3028297 RepID=A0AAE4MJA5_9EURY|nr:hypothetical protein [Methanosarcinaceae archaeon Ag5]
MSSLRERSLRCIFPAGSCARVMALVFGGAMRKNMGSFLIFIEISSHFLFSVYLNLFLFFSCKPSRLNRRLWRLFKRISQDREVQSAATCTKLREVSCVLLEPVAENRTKKQVYCLKQSMQSESLKQSTVGAN